MVTSVCGLSRPETGSHFARDMHGLEGGKIPNKESTYPYTSTARPLLAIWQIALQAKFISQNNRLGRSLALPTHHFHCGAPLAEIKKQPFRLAGRFFLILQAAGPLDTASNVFQKPLLMPERVRVS